MAIPMFLAMTAAEMHEKPSFSGSTAWMACHFSPYGTGLSNRPKALPPRSMLIVNDRTPVCGHDPELIAQQLSETVSKLACCAVLLDFQRKDEPETAAITNAVLQSAPCPVAVTEYYAQDHACPVFLPPVPPNIPVSTYLAPWKGRQIWLEAALDGLKITVSADGARLAPLSMVEANGTIHRDEELCCHYSIDIHPDDIQFCLYRTREDVAGLLSEAEQLGVTYAVGLFQELGHWTS